MENITKNSWYVIWQKIQFVSTLTLRLITEKGHGHCQVFLDGDTIFIAGGYNRAANGGPGHLNTGLSNRPRYTILFPATYKL